MAAVFVSASICSPQSFLFRGQQTVMQVSIITHYITSNRNRNNKLCRYMYMWHMYLNLKPSSTWVWYKTRPQPINIDGNHHYGDVIMATIASQITSLTIVYSTVYSDADQRKHQSSTSLAFVWGIHRGPVNSPHKWPVSRKMFPFDNVIMRDRWLGWEIRCLYRLGSCFMEVRTQ